MKGVIFTEFLEMVEGTGGHDLVDRIVETSGAPTQGAYTAVGTYDHTEIAALVEALSTELDTPVPDLLRKFGTHLFHRFTTLYPQFISESGDAFDFLESVEDYIHVEVRKLYPAAELPRFECSRRDGALDMVYHSSRHLEDLAEGLILGCLEHFKMRADVSRASDPSGGIRFTVTKKP